MNELGFTTEMIIGRDVGVNFALVSELAKQIGLDIKLDAALGTLTTYRVGGKSKIEVIVRQNEDLGLISQIVNQIDGLGLLVLGNGSNVLVSDDGYPGLVVRLSDNYAYEKFNDDVVEIGGSRALPIAARRIATKALAGFEWAVGVPGALGGAVRMNAGGHGSEISESLICANIYDFEQPSLGLSEISNNMLGLKYRHSVVTPTQIVINAKFRFKFGQKDDSLDKISRIVTWRRENQPGGQNAGSVFVNPPGLSAGKIIEDAGLKGSSYRTATVSAKHANFIQAQPEGCARDVHELMAIIRDTVMQKFGVRLRTEIRLVGFCDDYGLTSSEDY